MALLEVKQIEKQVGSGASAVKILKGINLSIEKGDFVAIIGASGSGKSTLMNILGCLDNEFDGSYQIDGQEVGQLDSNQLSDLRQQQFGFIFQRYNLLPSLSAQDNVALPAIYAGLPTQERRERAQQLLEKLGLGDKAQHKPNQLSGGQQQRVSIARALMNGGEIILADEPTGALDSKSGETVMEILQDLHREGHTLILVTHDPKIAAHAQRVIEIRDGEILRDERQAPLAANAAETASSPRKPRFFDQLLESFNMAVNAILAHKLRALLTMLGIIIGITSVISVVALGTGSQEQILSNINGLGTNTMEIYNGSGFGDRRANLTRNLTTFDASALEKQPYIENASPSTSSSGTLIFQNKDMTGQLRGVSEQFFSAKGIKLQTGQLFTQQEVDEAAQVVVIDNNTLKELNVPNPVGGVILFNKIPLKIIGIAKNDNNQNTNLTLWTPYSTLMQRISGSKTIDSITVKVKDNVESQIAEKSLTELLTTRHGKKDFFVMNSDTIKQAIESTTGTMTLLISSIAFISLLVGGIGVMNIMLVSVTERTKEIGVRMAIGARQSNILQQFLIEAVLICLIGGLAGVLFAVGISVGFNLLGLDFKMAISNQSVIVAVLCSTLIGVLFGFMPARNASRLNPITALAQE